MFLTLFFFFCVLIFGSITFAFSKDAHKIGQSLLIKTIFFLAAAISLWSLFFCLIAFVAWII